MNEVNKRRLLTKKVHTISKTLETLRHKLISGAEVDLPLADEVLSKVLKELEPFRYESEFIKSKKGRSATRRSVVANWNW